MNETFFCDWTIPGHETIKNMVQTEQTSRPSSEAEELRGIPYS